MIYVMKLWQIFELKYNKEFFDTLFCAIAKKKKHDFKHKSYLFGNFPCELAKLFIFPAGKSQYPEIVWGFLFIMTSKMLLKIGFRPDINRLSWLGRWIKSNVWKRSWYEDDPDIKSRKLKMSFWPNPQFDVLDHI